MCLSSSPGMVQDNTMSTLCLPNENETTVVEPDPQGTTFIQMIFLSLSMCPGDLDVKHITEVHLPKLISTSHKCMKSFSFCSSAEFNGWLQKQQP